eukprot:TRINITY_DN1899_c0_g2_i1.p1 TRINITY_DN1899_c0_g2~~TRINITY_DN1899_c0_g2_i1.p1  ORF type:complete len:672 (+),score=210.74 TRINITY_DN1899_c0_g2_i1:48-2063(+)
MSDIPLWIRDETQPEGREVKIYLSESCHIADLAIKAAEILRFNGEQKSRSELVLKDQNGNELRNMMSIVDLPKNSVVLIGLINAEDPMGPRSKSWSGPESTAQGNTWVGRAMAPNEAPHDDMDDDILCDARDEVARQEDDDDDDECEGLPSRTTHRTWQGMPSERETSQFIPTGMKSSNSQKDFEEEDEGMPSRNTASTWHPEMNTIAEDDDRGVHEERARTPPQFHMKPGATLDTTGDGQIDSVLLDTTGDGIADTLAPLVVPVYSSPVTAGAQLLVDTTGDGLPDSILSDTTGDGCGDRLIPLDDSTPVHTLILPTAPRNAHSRVAVTKGPVPAVYVDRIPPDASDEMIIDSINNNLAPYGVAKVQSLEVIRNQKTRHCHAFAFLSHQPPNDLTPIRLGDTEEFIRVQPSDKERAVPMEVTPRSTLHVRLYARRQGWAANISKMEWTGLLCILEDVQAKITDCVNIVADDRSKKNKEVHMSVCLCAFFVECHSTQQAMYFRKAVHDKRTTAANDVVFLIQCDYTLTDKKLHDTCKKREAIFKQYADAMKRAREFTKAGGIGKLWPAKDMSQYFEMDQSGEETQGFFGGKQTHSQHHQHQHQHHQQQQQQQQQTQQQMLINQSFAAFGLKPDLGMMGSTRFGNDQWSPNARMGAMQQNLFFNYGQQPNTR